MPRRRMIGPEFWTDRKIGYLTRDERGFILGCIGQADDEGRLQSDPAFLKAEIYKYDDDLDSAAVKELRDSCLSKMETWPANHSYHMVSYINSDEEYIFFPNWGDIQKPSHPTKSKLPTPPPELLPLFSSAPQEPVVQSARESPSQSSLGQSSQGKYSIGKSSAVLEDFTKYLDSEKDLTDFLTTTLTKYLPRGPTAAVDVLYKLWEQAMGQTMPQTIFELTFDAVRKYPVPVLARSYAKLVKYKGGKTGSWKYLDKILKEQMEKEKPP